jgi:hypothetical protein
MASKASQDQAETIVTEHMAKACQALERWAAVAELSAGYATCAAARSMPAYRIQSHTRHKSAQVVAGYIREADKWTKSGLDGVGF